MALTPETFEVLQQSREYLLQRSSSVTYSLTQAWVDAWNAIQGDLESAAQGLAGTDPRRSLLARRAALVGDTAGVLVTDALQAAGEVMSAEMAAAVANAEKQQILAASTQVPPPQAAAFGASLNRVDPLQLEAIALRSTESIMVGWSSMPEHVQSAVRTNLFKGVAFGSHPTVVARKIMDNAQGAFAGGLSRAIRVARTEMLDAHRNASGAWRQTNKDVVAGWRWLATLDTRTCPSCLAKNGNRYAVDDPGPLDHPNGRCDAVPETKSWKELGFEEMEEPPDTFPDARAWYDSLDPAAQKSIMGPGRQALLADGKIGWGDLSTRVSSQGWRASYTVRSLRDLRDMPDSGLDAMPYELNRGHDTAPRLSGHDPKVREAVAERIRELMEEATENPVSINVNSDALESILRDGRFRTVHESGLESGGWDKSGYYLETRNSYNRDILGMPDGVPDAHKPISGWSAASEDMGDLYGDVQVVLSDRVKGRTSWTFSDSMDGSSRPLFSHEIKDASTEDLLWAANRNGMSDAVYTRVQKFGYEDLVPKKPNQITKADVAKTTPYVEAQVYGGVSIKDINHVVLKRGVHSTSMEGSLKAAGVKVRWLS